MFYLFFRKEEKTYTTGILTVKKKGIYFPSFRVYTQYYVKNACTANNYDDLTFLHSVQNFGNY